MEYHELWAKAQELYRAVAQVNELATSLRAADVKVDLGINYNGGEDWHTIYALVTHHIAPKED